MQVFNFEFDCEYGVFKDAIILDDNVIISDDDLQLMKQKRFDNWYAIITNPVATVWQTDADGNQILDENDNPIPVEA